MTKKGFDPVHEVWKATCDNCHSKFEAERRELAVTDDQRDGAFAHAKCELCGDDMVFYPPRSGR